MLGSPAAPAEPVICPQLIRDGRPALAALSVTKPGSSGKQPSLQAPSPGSVLPLLIPGANLHQGRRRSHITPRPPDRGSSLAESTSTAEHSVSQGKLSFPCSESPPETTSSRQRVDQLAISPQQELSLDVCIITCSDYSGSLLSLPQFTRSLEKYFDIVQDASPIFSRDRFLQRYKDFCSRDLISTICVITAKVTGFELSADSSCLDVYIDMLLSSSLLEVDMIGDSPSLDQFRKACLLAFYEFHQFPGHQSWLRIGRLTRMAYRVGLDRLENMRALYSDWKTVDEKDMQEWRTVRWCIYRLDSYSNLASGTPFPTEDDHINTALVQCQPADLISAACQSVLRVPEPHTPLSSPASFPVRTSTSADHVSPFDRRHSTTGPCGNGLPLVVFQTTRIPGPILWW
ncbi:hypothetical protein ACJZ2D_000365 [Fusarium nematophilum]